MRGAPHDGGAELFRFSTIQFQRGTLTSVFSP